MMGAAGLPRDSGMLTIDGVGVWSSQPRLLVSIDEGFI